MISPFLKRYIKQRCKETGKEFPLNYQYKLKVTTNIVNSKILEKFKPLIIIFDTIDSSFTALSANSVFPYTVIINGEWSFYISCNELEDLSDVLLSTIGHELGHKNKYYYPILCAKSTKKFINAINEVYADFHASVMFDTDIRNTLITTMQHKYNYKVNYYSQTDEDNEQHPSWKHRIEYRTNYIFNDSLILHIAVDYNYKNGRIINKLIDYYYDYFINLDEQ